MHDYSSVRRQYGRNVAQSLDEPIKIFDLWQLSDGFATLIIVLFFGVILYEWLLMLILLFLNLGLVPAIRNKSERGVFLHTPYFECAVSLPHLFNPKKRVEYSD